jgi:hypothetical protein
MTKIVDGVEYDDDMDELMIKIVRVLTDKLQLYVDVDNTIKIRKKVKV